MKTPKLEMTMRWKIALAAAILAAITFFLSQTLFHIGTVALAATGAATAAIIFAKDKLEKKPMATKIETEQPEAVPA